MELFSVKYVDRGEVRPTLKVLRVWGESHAQVLTNFLQAFPTCQVMELKELEQGLTTVVRPVVATVDNEPYVYWKGYSPQCPEFYINSMGCPDALHENVRQRAKEALFYRQRQMLHSPKGMAA